MESMSLSGQHATRAFTPLQEAFEASLPPTADILVAFATIVCRFAAFPGASGRRPYLYTQSVCVACFASKQKEAEAEISRFLLLWFYDLS